MKNRFWALSAPSKLRYQKELALFSFPVHPIFRSFITHRGDFSTVGQSAQWNQTSRNQTSRNATPGSVPIVTN